MVERAGSAHVGLGIDLEYDLEGWQAFFLANREKYWRYYASPPLALFQPEELPRLTEAMLRLGYREDVVLGVLGENFLRVAAAVWK